MPPGRAVGILGGMPSTPTLASFALAATALILLPGPAMLFLVSRGIGQGRRLAFASTLGIEAATATMVVLTAFGLSALISSSVVAFSVVKYAGAAYLVYLGLRQFFASPHGSAAVAESRRDEPAFSMFRRGVWVNLLNPKAIVFFLAFMPGFIRLDEPQLPQYLVLIATVVAVDILVMWFFFAAAARSFQRFTRTVRGLMLMNRTFGVLFISVGLMLALL